MTETKKELQTKWNYLSEEYSIGNINLNTWEEEFLDSINEQLFAEDGYLTDLQILSLEKAYDKYNK